MMEVHNTLSEEGGDARMKSGYRDGPSAAVLF